MNQPHSADERPQADATGVDRPEPRLPEAGATGADRPPAAAVTEPIRPAADDPSTAVAQTPVAGIPVTETPVVGTPVVGTPVVGTPVVGIPVTETPVVGTPVVGTPDAPALPLPVPPDADGQTAPVPGQAADPLDVVDLGFVGDPGPMPPAPGMSADPGTAGSGIGVPGVAGPPRRTGSWLAAMAVVGLVSGLLGGIIGGWTFQQMRQSTLQDRSITLPVPTKGSTARASDSVAGIAARLLPGVVSIKVSGSSEEGTGSGFIIDRAGYILTNNHVVNVAANGGSITIVYSDGRHASAKVVGRDQSYDLAVVKADIGDRAALQLGDSDGVVVGDTVIAVGAPLGLQGTVTTGIVSALNRPVAAGGGQTQAFINAIQTDAAINPGNSGGPLVDAAGRVIGINSAIARSPGSLGATSGNIGVGFAIPSNQARRTAEQLIRTGHSEHPVIGVLLDRSYTGQGVKVSAAPVDGQEPVSKDGPADRAGIKPGDLIIAFNGRPVTDPDELVVAIRAQTPGDEVRLTIRRNGFDREVRVTLQASTK